VIKYSWLVIKNKKYINKIFIFSNNDLVENV